MHTLLSNSGLAENIVQTLFSSRAFENNPATEQNLAEAFGVSRTPVRDALKELEKEGILERRKSKGVWLKKPSLADIADVHDVRSVLEGFACRLASERTREKDLTELRKSVRRFEQAVANGDLKKKKAADISFHNKIVELSGSPLIKKLMANFRMLRKAFELAWLSEPNAAKPKVSPYPHRKIIKALERGKGEECERMMRNHIQYSKRGLLEQALSLRLNCFEESK